MDLEKAKKKRDEVAGIVNMRIRSVVTLLQESKDIVKLTAGKDGLEMELDNLKSLQAEVMHILLENADKKLLSEEEENFGVIKDKEHERVELLSRKSDRSSNAKSFVTRSSSMSSKRISAARAEAVALRPRLGSGLLRLHGSAKKFVHRLHAEYKIRSLNLSVYTE